MKSEYFKEPEVEIGIMKNSLISTISKTYKQERDWTCSIACLRTILSSKEIFLEESVLISKNNIIMGPQSSLDIKNWLKDEPYIKNMKFGCDKEFDNMLDADRLSHLLKNYNVMTECLVNYAHWIVILGYYKLGKLSDDILVFYDPYFNQVRLMPGEEFFSMWYGINDYPFDKDFVAIKK